MKSLFSKAIDKYLNSFRYPRNDKIAKFVIIILNFVLLLRVVSYAWVTDDAFISFRSVINFVQGFGPVYNVGERVQSFTHPLWFLLLSLGGWMNLNLYFWAITLGVVFTIGLLWIFYRTFQKSGNLFCYILVLITLIFSESFLTFQTSGLENSLINILVATFFYLYIFGDQEETKGFSLLMFVGSLILLNRMDNIVIIILPLLHAFISKRDKVIKKLKVTVLSFLPIILWLCFSVIYYGFLFPNTKYVKAGGRTLVDSIMQGSRYILEYANTEIPIIILLIVATVIVFRRARQRKYKILIASIFLQILYILLLGGDFMRGRFLVVVSITTVFMVLNLPLVKKVNMRSSYLASIIGVFLVLSATTYYCAFKEQYIVKFPGMENERNFYKEYLALNLDSYHNYNNHPWAVAGQEINISEGDKKTVIIGMNGLRGYFINRNITLIDLVGLTDAFISRLPVIDSTRTGHFVKDIPPEYLEERVSGTTVAVWKNKAYKALNEHINTIIRSDKLFSVGRFKAMIWVWKNYGL